MVPKEMDERYYSYNLGQWELDCNNAKKDTSTDSVHHGQIIFIILISWKLGTIEHHNKCPSTFYDHKWYEGYHIHHWYTLLLLRSLSYYHVIHKRVCNK